MAPAELADGKGNHVNIFRGNDIKLHIGGAERHHGWTNLNIAPGPHVDQLGRCNDLSFLQDESCSEVYASHVLEHLTYDGELGPTLRGFYRVLKPGGRLRVSVPDLEILCQLFLHPQLMRKHREQVMRMMFGGHLDEYDAHKCGLTFETLDLHLKAAGFKTVIRVEKFGEFEDTSQLEFGGVLISANVEAYK